MIQRRSRAGRWLPVSFWLALIFAGSSIPLLLPVRAQEIHVDWAAHIVEYFVLGFLLSRALAAGRRRAWNPAVVAVLVIAAGTCYGMMDEYHQQFVPNRNPSALDVVADFIGVTLGAYAQFLKRKRTDA